MYTRGYTGAQKKNQRYETLYSEDIDNIKKIALFDCIESLKKIDTISAFDFTHFVRGELFVYVDMLLTSNFKEKNPEDIEAEEIDSIIETCKMYCDLYHTWLTVLPKTFKDVILNIIIVSPSST